jgi:CheY-like chemotaxis protein
VGAVTQNLTAKGQTITVLAPPETLHVDADPVRIAQVLANLLLNASKFTGHGGRIDVVAVRADLDGSPAVRIDVTDNGIGIAPDQLEHIFEPYVQASTEASPFPEGLGLGLSVARRLVELHGGVIRAHSDGIGRGSTFIVELPLCNPPAIADASPADAGQHPRRARILIADDDADSAAMLSSLLQLMGHETHRAHDGHSAIAIADEVRPDIVILDIRMPQLDGRAAARMLRERSWARNVVLYALSGWGEPNDSGAGEGSEFDRRFVKPVGIDELTAAIGADLRERRSGASLERSA